MIAGLITDSVLLQHLGWRLYDERCRCEIWAAEYHSYRYLENISDTDLQKRYTEIRKNILFLVGEKRDVVPIEAHFLSTWWWVRKLFHTLLEFQSRRQVPVCLEASERYLASQPFIEPAYPNECSFLVRYGELDHMQAMVDHGSVMVSSASVYDDTSLGQARCDNELEKSHFVTGSNTRITTQEGVELPVIGDVTYTNSTRLGYFVFCCSNKYDSRLHAEFADNQGKPAEASIIIHDVEEFGRRFHTAGEHHFSDAVFYHNPVRYYDPYELVAREQIDPVMSKDFRFAYQREYRFIWLLRQPMSHSDRMILELGSLKDIAEMRVIP